jgi:hypothetical protein
MAMPVEDVEEWHMTTVRKPSVSEWKKGSGGNASKETDESSTRDSAEKS